MIDSTSTSTSTSHSDGRRGEIASLHISPGGVPKLAVPEARVHALGLDGDDHHDRRHHGGPERAICLFSVEIMATLNAEGHPIAPGSTGENVAVRGIDWALMVPGARVRLGGDVELEITRYTTPCKTIRASFADGDFQRILQADHPGESRVYAKVLRDGTIRAGDPISVFSPT
jgi:MOSC domain-containing protein YiiM